MLKNILDSAHLSRRACANIISVDPGVFDEWVAGQRKIPTGYARALSALLGVPIAALEQKTDASTTDPTPAIWFRLREAGITDSDRTHIAVIRRLAHLYDQFESATGSPSVVWRAVFDSVTQQVDFTTSPAEQGRAAARIVRTERGLAQGSNGIGSLFRGHLRSLGLLIVETPVPRSKVEGCSFYVHSASAQRPCIFANTHSNTWFRRNFVLCHETAHLIFDALRAGASIDFANDVRSPADEVEEQRADAFAQEMLAPASVVRHVAQAAGIDWKALTPDDLATLVSKIEVEPKVIIKAAVEAKLLDADGAERARGFEIQSRLEQLTERALPAMKYFARYPDKKADWLDKRATTSAGVSLRLPAAYVQNVVEAAQQGTISWSKAAELLIVDRRTFRQRFGELMPAAE